MQQASGNIAGRLPWISSREVTPHEPEWWVEDGNCYGSESPDDWFSSEGTAEAESAKASCASCWVQTQCLTSAMARGETFGIWGSVQFETLSLCANGVHSMTEENILSNVSNGQPYESCRACKNKARRELRAARELAAA